MQNIRQLLVALLLITLAACGGGGTMDGSGGGTGGGTTPPANFTLSVAMVNVAGEEIRVVSQEQSGEIRATLQRNNQPLENQLVSFSLSGNVGVLSPLEGTARTDASGVARLQLSAGQVPGAGAITASYTASDQTITSSPFVFDSTGDLSSSVSLTVQVLNQENEEVRTLAHSTPRKLVGRLLVDGQPAPFRIVRFVSEFSGVINPNSGLAMTDETGLATVDLLAGSVAGGGQAFAEFTSSNNVVTRSTVFAFTSAGDAPVQGDTSGFLVSLNLLNATSLLSVTNIDADNPALVRAQVTTLQNEPVINKVVTFNSTLGRFRPSLGTALTDNNGFAELVLTAGTIEGAGTVVAQYESASTSVGFYTRGNEIDSSQVSADVSFRILTDCADTFRTERNPAQCTETTSISAEKPGILYVRVVRSGTTTPLNQVLVTAETSLGNISPSTGTAITDANGIALLDLLAGRDVGAGLITISALNTSTSKAFEIGAAQVTISVSSGLAVGQQLAAGSTTLISVEIRNSENELYTPPLDVEFTSNCVLANQAVIDQRVTSIGGVARATYRAEGCVGNDTVTATVITGGDSVTGSVVVPVSASNIGALEFVSASTDYLALKGTGGLNRSETAIVQFRLVDENGGTVAGRDVRFALSTEVGGLSLDPLVAQTNNSGLVQTTIRSGTVPTPVRVIAIYADENQVIQAPSDNLTVSTGVADQNSFSLSRESFNVHGLNFDGTEVKVNVFLADHFNNFVPDGTAVSFIAEGGSIQPSCLTQGGGCSVIWRSQNPRPFTDMAYGNTIFEKCNAGLPCPLGIVNNDLTLDRPLGGRATIMAYAIGEESFSDRNGNGRFDPEDFVAAYDIGEAFIDHNENGFYDGTPCVGGDPLDPCAPANSDGGEFEEFIDFNSNGVRDTANGLYNGLLCSVEQDLAGICSRELVNVFQNQVIVMSGDQAYMRLVTYAADCSAIVGVQASVVRANIDNSSPIITNSSGLNMCNVNSIDISSGFATSVSLQVFISDRYNNPLPVGSTVAISADNGVLAGTTSYTFPNTTSVVPVSIGFVVTREPVGQGNNKEDGFLSVVVTATSGLVSTLTVPVKDDR